MWLSGRKSGEDGKMADVVDSITSEDILAELEELREKRRNMISNSKDKNIVSESMTGRQTVWEGANALDALNRHEKYLLQQLRRIQRTGIPLRTGVPAH